MNWMEIDKILHSMISIYSDKELLYSDVKKKFKWTDSQVEAAVGPLLRYGDLKKVEEIKPKTNPKKRKTKRK